MVLERRLRQALPTAQLRLLDRVLDRRPQTAEPVLEHVVHRALTHGGHRQVVTDRARHDHEGNLQAGILHQLQGS